MKRLLLLSLSMVSVCSFASEQVIGVGLELYQDKNWNIAVERVFSNTSAAREQLWEDMIIESIEGKYLVGKDVTEAQAMLLGSEGSDISVTVLDHGTRKEVTLKREKYEAPLPCFLKGEISLREPQLSQFPISSGSHFRPHKILGKIGDENVEFLVIGNELQGWVKNEKISLNLRSLGDALRVTGFIHGRNINWSGSGYRLYGNQRCIANLKD